jgi:hypothetical protein
MLFSSTTCACIHHALSVAFRIWVDSVRCRSAMEGSSSSWLNKCRPQPSAPLRTTSWPASFIYPTFWNKENLPSSFANGSRGCGSISIADLAGKEAACSNALYFNCAGVSFSTQPRMISSHPTSAHKSLFDSYNRVRQR